MTRPWRISALRRPHRGGRRRLATRTQACDFLFEFLRERAIFRHHIGAGLRSHQLLLLEIEDIAVTLAGLDQFIDELRRLSILESRHGLCKVACCRCEPVLDRRQQISRRQVGRFNKDTQDEVGFGTQLEDRLQRHELVAGQPGKHLLDDLQVLVVGGGL